MSSPCTQSMLPLSITWKKKKVSHSAFCLGWIISFGMQQNDAGFGGQAGATATTADATRLWCMG